MPGSLEPLDVGVQIPYYFRCPISLELMRDPVTVSTGQTYDRPSIESWVATGNTTCPVTRVPLTDFTLIPNHTLRRLIQEWCVAHRHFGVERIPTPKQPADPAAVRTLLHQSASVSTPPHLRLSALRRLRNLARDSEKNRGIIAAHSPQKVLLSVLFSNTNLDSSELNHEALAVLCLFPLIEPECVFVSANSDRVNYLVSLLFHASVEVKVNAAAMIEMVVAGARSTELRSEICNAEGIYEGVVGVFTIAYPRAVKVGVKALFALCLVKQHRQRAVAAGAVEALVDGLAAGMEKCDAERALAAVELLCKVPAGCAAFAGHALTVPVLVKVILKVSDRATEYAAGALLALCTAAEGCQREAVAAGVVTQLLLLVQSECTERAKRKAQMLLKLLRDSWPEDSVGGNFDDFNCSDVVPY